MIADPTIAWRILLTATVGHPVDLGTARDSLGRLYAAQGWTGSPLVIEDADPTSLRWQLGGLHEPVVALGLADRQVVVAADHDAVDGLGLLTVLSSVLGSPVTSAARGVGDRPDASGPAAAVVRRLAEVALAPPARVRGSGGLASATHDTYVSTTAPGSWRTADLVVAAVHGLDLGRRVAVAVGVAREHDPTHVADRSALIRIRDAGTLDVADVRELLRTAPTQAPPGGSAPGGGGGVVRLGLRMLAPRLGSTVLVSHLGAVTAPGVEELEFHPVTGGGSGLSLGAVTLRDATTLTLRARGRDWGEAELAELLDRIVRSLDQGA